jgi:hypothetical protein
MTKTWLKAGLYFILALIIMVLPYFIYSMTEEYSLLYFSGALLLSGLLSLKLAKII